MLLAPFTIVAASGCTTIWFDCSVAPSSVTAMSDILWKSPSSPDPNAGVSQISHACNDARWPASDLGFFEIIDKSGPSNSARSTLAPRPESTYSVFQRLLWRVVRDPTLAMHRFCEYSHLGHLRTSTWSCCRWRCGYSCTMRRSALYFDPLLAMSNVRSTRPSEPWLLFMIIVRTCFMKRHISKLSRLVNQMTEHGSVVTPRIQLGLWTFHLPLDEIGFWSSVETPAHIFRVIACNVWTKTMWTVRTCECKGSVKCIHRTLVGKCWLVHSRFSGSSYFDLLASFTGGRKYDSN